MSFSFKVNTKNVAEQPNRSSYSYTPSNKDTDFGIVYILEIHMENPDGSIQKFIKCGVTKRRVGERVGEILASIWIKARYYPKTIVKRYSGVQAPYAFESEMHSKLSKYSARLPFKHDGYSEIFDCPLQYAVEIYDEMLLARKKEKKI